MHLLCTAAFQARKSCMLLMTAMLDRTTDSHFYHCVNFPLDGTSFMATVSFRLAEKAHFCCNFVSH